MIIIGEKLNSTIKSVMQAIELKDKQFIQDLAARQVEAGAAYIDVNAGMFFEDEPEKLSWMVETVQEVCSAPFSVDTPNPKALEAALKMNRNSKPLINSITDEKERYNAVEPLITEYNTSVVALCMDDNGMPETAEDRMTVAHHLIEKLTKKGLQLEDIYMDPMVRPIGTGSHYGKVALETIWQIKHSYPEVHIACGLSNISFGIPMRKLMNQTFLVAAIAAGMDGAILDPLDKKLMSLILTSEALMGTDDFCMEFIGKYREGFFEGG